MEKNLLELLRGPKMTLIMSLPANDPALARAAWEQGADVVKVHINVEHRASRTLFGTFAEERERLEQILTEAKGPCGIVAGGDLDSAVRDYPLAAEAGFSFVSLYARHMPPELLQFRPLTKMVALDHGYCVEEVMSLERVGGEVLEASVMAPDTYGQRLSAKELMQYDSICRHTSLPVVVPTQRAILPGELSALRRCGVAAIMIGAVVTGKEAQSIARAVAAFRAEIDRMA